MYRGKQIIAVGDAKPVAAEKPAKKAKTKAKDKSDTK
jgi:hypothetical protein